MSLWAAAVVYGQPGVCRQSHALGEAAFALWGNGEPKTRAAEQRFAELYKELQAELNLGAWGEPKEETKP